MPASVADKRIRWGLAMIAALVAAISARPHAGAWNDGSRLAMVESLVDRHTLAIDDSPFVNPGPDCCPYPADNSLLCQRGTLDKIFVGGHYYSDKSPVPGVLMAGLYQLLNWLTGLSVRDRPGLFCYSMTLGSSGLAYVVTVVCLYALARGVGLTQGLALALTGSQALATISLSYARHVNNHELLLGVLAALMLAVQRLTTGASGAPPGARQPLAWGRLLWVGCLAGLGYSIDLGVGPVLILAIAGLTLFHFRSAAALAAVALGALPWMALHHGLNYAVGGVWQPANALPEYLDWPGSPFGAENMTGSWKHDSLWRWALYAADMLVGKQGFLGHNLPLFLAVPGSYLLARRRTAERGAALFAVALCLGTWLLYSASSNNHSGVCCSIRWFVPLLAPGYYLLAIVLRDEPRLRPDFYWLSGVGLIVACLGWWAGPWAPRMVPGYWFWLALALLGWWRCQAKRQPERSRRTGQTAWSHDRAPSAS